MKLCILGLSVLIAMVSVCAIAISCQHVVCMGFVCNVRNL